MTPSLTLARRTAIIVTASALLPAAVALALVPARGHVAPPTVALILVLVVVTIAGATGRRAAALLAALSAGLSFDYFHTRPYGSLSIRRGEDIQTAALLLVTALVVGELAAWGRRHRDTAVDAADQLSRLAAIAHLVEGTAASRTIVPATAVELTELLRLADCRFDRSPPPRPTATIHDNGEIVHVGRTWPAERVGLPGPEVDLPVRHGGETSGHFRLTPTAGAPVSLQRRRTAVILAALIGATLASSSPEP